MPDFDLLSQFHFLRPAWFLVLIPFAIVTYLQWRASDLGRQWQHLIAPHLLRRMMVPGSQRQLVSPLWISVGVMPLLVVALAGPSWQRGESAVDSAAVVIAIDLSESMGSVDIQPDRLQRARKNLDLAKNVATPSPVWWCLLAHAHGVATV